MNTNMFFIYILVVLCVCTLWVFTSSSRRWCCIYCLEYYNFLRAVQISIQKLIADKYRNASYHEQQKIRRRIVFYRSWEFQFYLNCLIWNSLWLTVERNKKINKEMHENHVKKDKGIFFFMTYCCNPRSPCCIDERKNNLLILFLVLLNKINCL